MYAVNDQVQNRSFVYYITKAQPQQQHCLSQKQLKADEIRQLSLGTSLLSHRCNNPPALFLTVVAAVGKIDAI